MVCPRASTKGMCEPNPEGNTYNGDVINFDVFYVVVERSEKLNFVQTKSPQGDKGDTGGQQGHSGAHGDNGDNMGHGAQGGLAV